MPRCITASATTKRKISIEESRVYVHYMRKKLREQTLGGNPENGGCMVN